ncbi:hypothetical protein KUV41_02940 [Halomonas sp. DP8Y7-1]|nr:hypothetical protein [Halomonas sp. DP8Y7-1]
MLDSPGHARHGSDSVATASSGVVARQPCFEPLFQTASTPRPTCQPPEASIARDLHAHWAVAQYPFDEQGRRSPRASAA